MGTGIQDNLADKAKKLGIPVWKFGDGGVHAPPHPIAMTRASGRADYGSASPSSIRLFFDNPRETIE
jgi:hypothetical protein